MIFNKEVKQMRKLRIEEVAMLIGVSVQTLERWYKFKREHPDSDIAHKLPDYEVVTTAGAKQTRMWSQDAVWALTEFKTTRKLGRTGTMGKYGGTGSHAINT